MKQKQKGYIIPDEPIADDCGCFVVFYPDRPEYLYALKGALQYFETWVAWDKDGTNRASLAASQWKLANQLTRDNMNCMDGIGDGLVAIAEAIAGRDCCGEGVNPVDVVGTPPDWLGGDDGLGGGSIGNPPANWDNTNDYEDYKCRASGAIVYDLQQTLIKMSSLSGMLGVVGFAAFAALVNTSLLSGLVVGLMAIGLSASGAVFVLVGAFVTLAASGVGGLAILAQVANNIDTESLVCELFISLNTSDAEIYVTQAIVEAFALIGDSSDKSNAETFVGGLAELLITKDMFKSLFNYDAEIANRAPLHSCDCGAVDLSGYKITLGGGTAINWVTQEALLWGKEYEIQGSGSDASKWGAAYAQFSCQTLAGAPAAVELEIVAISGVQTDSNCGSNKELSFWIPCPDSTNVADWGYCFIPPVGYHQEYIRWIQLRGKANTTWSITFKVINARPV